MVECILVVANGLPTRCRDIIFILESRLANSHAPVVQVLTSGVGKSSDGLGRVVIFSLQSLS
jgi:hypothetical protein